MPNELIVFRVVKRAGIFNVDEILVSAYILTLLRSLFFLVYICKYNSGASLGCITNHSRLSAGYACYTKRESPQKHPFSF
jgi:hypothetical protein